MPNRETCTKANVQKGPRLMTYAKAENINPMEHESKEWSNSIPKGVEFFNFTAYFPSQESNTFSYF
jgi:hypothetical protein